MSRGREGSAGLMIADSIWWVSGGLDYQGNALDTTEVLLSSTGTFSPFIPLPKGYAYHTTLLLNEAQVLLCGTEDNIQITGISFSGEWSELPPSNFGHKYGACGLAEKSDGTKLLVVAGGIEEERTEVYNFAEESWKIHNSYLFVVKAQVLPYGRSFLIFGGSNDTKVIHFRPDTEGWGALLNEEPEFVQMKFARVAFAAIEIPESYAHCP